MRTVKDALGSGEVKEILNISFVCICFESKIFDIKDVTTDFLINSNKRSLLIDGTYIFEEKDADCTHSWLSTFYLFIISPK